MCLSIKLVCPSCLQSGPRHSPYTKTAPVKQKCEHASKKPSDPEQCQGVRAETRRGEKPCKACLDAKAEEKKQKERSAKRERFKKDLAEKRKMWDSADKEKEKGC